MNFFVRRPWDLPRRVITSENVYHQRAVHRREFLISLGVGTGAVGFWNGCQSATDSADAAAAQERGAAAKTEPVPNVYPSQRNPKFKDYGRPETVAAEAARYTNFYEFSVLKSTYKYVDAFKPKPWEIEVGGLCDKPRKFDLDDLHRLMPFEERAYRHRCVETWAMCVPWIGFPLRELLKLVEPQAQAKYVGFVTFDRPNEAPNMKRGRDQFPWPYTEGLTIAEAMNELAFIATGIYGKPLPKQHGAPVRLAVPWKYGFKSIKSIVRIVLMDRQPPTFWNTTMPAEYDFEANVNPNVPHPRWSQRSERMLGTNKRYPTVIYNGYGDYVGSLYKS